MEHRKVIGTLFLAVALVVPLVSACAGQAPAGTAKSSGSEVKAFVHFAGGGGTGASRVYTTSLAQLLQKYTKIEAAVETTSGKEIYPQMNKGEMDLLATSMFETRDAYLGKGIEKTRVRDIAAGAPPAATIAVVLARTGPIKTIKDLKGKAFAGESPQREWYAQMSDILLKANGLSRSDVKWVVSATSTEAIRDITEKRIDAATLPIGPRIVELDKAVGAYIVPLSPQEQAAIGEGIPGFVPYLYPKGLYEYKYDAPTVMSPTHIMVRAGMPDEVAYTITKTMFDNIKEFHAVSDQNEGFTLQVALSNIVFPVHPGAVKYYKEVGAWKPEHDKIQQDLLAKEKALYGS